MKRIAMFSVHGYFDPIPRLGATDTGGQVVYVIDLAKAIARTGVKVDIYTRQFDGRLREEPINDDVRVIRLPCGPDEFIRKEELFKYWDEFIENLDGYMKENNLTYDVFHSHYWDAGYVAMKTTEKLGTWFVHTSHSLGAWKRELFKDVEGAEEMFRFEERVEQENIIFRAARGLTVTNQAGKDNYKRLYDFETENMVMLPPGVDINLYYPLKEGEKDIESGLPEKYILALARIDHNKGFDLLIDAFATIAHKHPDFSLVIGGGSKNPKQPEIELRKKLSDTAKSHNLEKRVIFTGYVPDEMMPAFYRGASLFALSSRFDPFGMTATEAMSCGTPVVVTSLGGIKYYLDDGENAMVANPKNADEFGAAMDKILADDNFRQKLVKNGLQTVYDKFTWDALAKKHIDFFKKLSKM